MNDIVVIMSIYKNDSLDHLKESVNSILNQTYRNFDFFICFDGPVAQGIDEFLNSIDDNRLKLFKLENNRGLAYALNYLLKLVINTPEYQFIARMDADDISMPERFEKQRNFLINNPKISCLGTGYEEINDSGEHMAYRKLPTDHNELRKLYFTRSPFAHPSVMYRTELVKIAGFYPTDTLLMEDNALWGNALFHGLKFSNIPEYLIKFRKNKSFYKRRSGLLYGYCYMRNRFRMARKLKLPAYSYVFSFLIGILKMMPPVFLKNIYRITHKP